MVKPTSESPLWYRILGGAFYVMVLGLVLFVGTAFGWINRTKMGRAVIGVVLHPKPPQEVFQDNALTLLILGCDEDLAFGGNDVYKHKARSDMMLVARLDFDTHRVTGLSIPRDTLFRLHGDKAEHKMNAFHAYGGDDMSKRAVEEMLGVSIDRVITIDFDAFQKMVDMVGGVNLFVDRNMDYDDKAGHLHIHLKSGKQHLDGYNAMCFVRFRHGDDDFKRQERQKQFMMAFKDATLSNWTKLFEIAEVSKKVMGDVLTEDEMASLALFSKKINQDNVKMGSLPVVPAGKFSFHVDKRALPKTLQEYHLLEESRVTLRR